MERSSRPAGFPTTIWYLLSISPVVLYQNTGQSLPLDLNFATIG